MLFSTNVTVLTGNIANLTVGLTGSNAAIATLQSTSVSYGTRISQNEVDIGALQLITPTYASNIGILFSNVVSLTNGIAGTNTNINTIQSNLTSYATYANSTFGTASGNVNAVQSNLTSYATYANSTFGTASGNVNAVQSNLTAYAAYANSTFSGGGGVNQDASYNWTNVHTFSNTISINAVSANGSLGSPGQVLSSTGTDTQWINAGGSSNVIVGNATTQSFTANGTQTDFILTNPIANVNNIIVTLNGLLQAPTTHYTISGSTLTFTSIPYTSSLVEIRSLEGGVGLNGGPYSTGNVPQNSQSSSYTLATSDVGKHISITTGGVIVPNTTFAVGDSVVIYNNSGSSQTITQGVNVTMRLVGTATTGNRTLAQYGLVTVLCVAANTFVSMGGGLA